MTQEQIRTIARDEAIGFLGYDESRDRFTVEALTESIVSAIRRASNLNDATTHYS